MNTNQSGHSLSLWRHTSLIDRPAATQAWQPRQGQSRSLSLHHQSLCRWGEHREGSTPHHTTRFQPHSHLRTRGHGVGKETHSVPEVGGNVTKESPVSTLTTPADFSECWPPQYSRAQHSANTMNTASFARAEVMLSQVCPASVWYRRSKLATGNRFPYRLNQFWGN